VRRLGAFLLIMTLATTVAGCAGYGPSRGERAGERPVFDDRQTAGYIGKYVLITLTYYDEDGEMVTQQQVHGIIKKADRARGFAVALQGVWEGETFWLPPDLRGFSPARRGEYQLNSTSEIIYDPDLIATWEITRSGPWL